MVAFERGCAVVTYKVIIGRIQTTVVMLNVACKAHRQSRRLIAIGSFGEILEVPRDQGNYVHKRVFFRSKMQVLTFARDMMSWDILANTYEIREIVRECAFNKIYSALRIGAQLPAVRSFDIVCYEDAIQFSMEKCQPLANAVVDLGKFKQRMLYCLRVLHSIGIIHKDIKPDNMAYSPSLKDFVFIDFGVSEWVHEKPGCRTEAYMEGTFQYMSPQMKKISPGCLGKVDLFWNDLYALTRSFEKVSYYTPSHVENTHPPITFVEIEDELFPALWSLHIQGKGFSAKLYERKEFTSKHIQQVLHYFPEWEVHDTSHSPQENDLQNNAEYLIRAIGPNINLVRHLTPLAKHDKKCEALLDKLENSSVLESQCRPNKIVNSRKLIELYQRLLLRQDPSDDSDSIMGQVKILLHIADIQLTLEHEEEQCVATLTKAISLYLKSNSKKDWVGYAKWLAQALRMPNCLPVSTQFLFKRPFEKREKYLLVRWIAKYYLSHTLSATQLCSYLTGRQYTDDSTKLNINLWIVSSVEELLEQAKPKSEEWLALASFVCRQLLELCHFDYLINKYSPIVNSLDSEARSQILCVLALAHRRQGRSRQALACCQQSLAIQKTLPAVDAERLVQQQTLLIILYQKLGEMEMAQSVAKEALKTEHRWDRLNIQQKLFFCLHRSNKKEKARILFEEMQKKIQQFTFPLTPFWRLMTNHLKILRFIIKEKWISPQPYLDIMTRFVFDMLEKAGNHVRSGIPMLESKAEALLILSTVCLSCNCSGLAVKVLDSILVSVVAYVWELNCGKAPHQEVLRKQSQELSKAYIQPCKSKIFLLIKKDTIPVYVYAAQIARLLALDRLEEIGLLVSQMKEARALQQAVDQRKHIISFLKYICLELNQRGKIAVVLVLLESHRTVSEVDDHFLKASLLLKLDRIEQSRLLFQRITKQERRDIIERAFAHEQLSFLYKILQSPSQSLREHQQQALLLYRKAYDRAPVNRDLWLNIGVCEMRLDNNKEAAVWLQRFLKRPQDIEKPTLEAGLVAFATCLNRLGRCRQSMHYFKQVIAAKPAQPRHAECLFYLAHNCYVLKRPRLVTKYFYRLMVVDDSKEYLQFFVDFLRKKGQNQRLQVIRKATLDQTSQQDQKPCNSAQLISKTIQEKRIALMKIMTSQVKSKLPKVTKQLPT